MNLGTIDYATKRPPPAYMCTSCGVTGCKLWREYQTCADYTDLLCCDCAGKNQGKDVSTIDEKGLRQDDHGCRTDQIGWLVPAVPTEDGTTFWGYTSVPSEGCTWWRQLPTRVPKQGSTSS